MNIQLPKNVKYSLNKLHNKGYDAYVVGGCVRDTLLNQTIKDWDITTSASPDQTIKVFQNNNVIETGLQHGTVTVILDGEPFEITTFRTDGNYSDGRHPDSVAFTSSLIEDLKRRDFTINAMAYNEEEGIIDPFGGQIDLKGGVIRCVGSPMDRFSEDALRMLRALRFSSRYGASVSIYAIASSEPSVAARSISACPLSRLKSVPRPSIKQRA